MYTFYLYEAISITYTRATFPLFTPLSPLYITYIVLLSLSPIYTILCTPFPYILYILCTPFPFFFRAAFFFPLSPLYLHTPFPLYLLIYVVIYVVEYVLLLLTPFPFPLIYLLYVYYIRTYICTYNITSFCIYVEKCQRGYKKLDTRKFEIVCTYICTYIENSSNADDLRRRICIIRGSPIY